MREIILNGYIDEEAWFGDEITPEALHDALYVDGSDSTEDVHIRLNSYGGSCNAAVRMHDDIRSYSGNVSITISGTAASAATVLAMAADHLTMTPGSLFMIHDPSTMAWGNERDMNEAIALLRACKDSILNVYGRRCKLSRDVVASMMAATTWLDSTVAMNHGFVDEIKEVGAQLTNCAETRASAEKKVKLWMERKMLMCGRLPSAKTADISAVLGAKGNPIRVVGEAKNPPAAEASPPEQTDNSPQPDQTGTPTAQLYMRLGSLMPNEKKEEFWNE